MSDAVERAERASREDMAEENDARNYLDNIRRVCFCVLNVSCFVVFTFFFSADVIGS